VAAIPAPVPDASQAPLPEPDAAGPSSAPDAGGSPLPDASGLPDGVLSAEQLVELITGGEMFPVPLESAPERLRVLGPFKQKQLVPEVLSLVGPERGPVRTELAYEHDATGRAWVFGQATFTLLPEPLPAVAGLYAQLSTRLQKKLGKPRSQRTEEGDQFPRVSWRLGKRIDLVLRESSSTVAGVAPGTLHLVIDVAEPGGEAD
jgi:hypothetical protein